MIVSSAALERLAAHWAVQAIPAEERDRAAVLEHECQAKRAAGRQIIFDFAESNGDDKLLNRVALAYEIAAIEGLDAMSRAAGGDQALLEQCVAAACRTFDIRRLFPIPQTTHERLFYILGISALAYCGDRRSDLRRWYQENAGALKSPSIAQAKWDQRLLFRIFECWVRLFRKDGLDDLHTVRDIIIGLREDQKVHEGGWLNSGPQSSCRSRAPGRDGTLRLISLYHWAKATEVVAVYMLQGGSQNIFALIDKNFEAAIKAAAASRDAQYEIILRWLYASASIMIQMTDIR